MGMTNNLIWALCYYILPFFLPFILPLVILFGYHIYRFIKGDLWKE